jgi:arginine repressor
MAKKTSQEGASKSDQARQYLSKHPGASVSQITDGLKAEGVTISTALASKIKYGRSKNGAAKKGRGRRKAPGRKSAKAAGSMSKAEEIRQSIRRFGKRFRPRDVVAELAEKGVEVSSAQVSTIAKSLGMRRRRKGRGRASASAGTGRRATNREATVSVSDLVATKKLAAQLGGIENVKIAIDALSKLA